MKADPAPRNAMAHIQNIAPGPPMAMAVATPAMFPVPTRPPRAMAKPWKLEMPEAEAWPCQSWVTMAFRWRTCRKRVQMEKTTPAPRQSRMSGRPHTQPLR